MNWTTDINRKEIDNRNRIQYNRKQSLVKIPRNQRRFSINNNLVTDSLVIANPLSYAQNVFNSIVITTVMVTEIRNIILVTKNNSPG